MKKPGIVKRSFTLLLAVIMLLGCTGMDQYATAWAAEIPTEESDPCEAGHSWINGVCSVCEAVCPHEQYLEGTCTVCGMAEPVTDPCEAGHNWINGVCPVCEAVCPHEQYFEGRCTVCGLAETVTDPCEAGHSWVNGVCPECEAVCPHEQYFDGKCTVCGLAETVTDPCKAGHSWVNGVCSVCEADCPHEQYLDGKCVECGKAEPQRESVKTLPQSGSIFPDDPDKRVTVSVTGEPEGAELSVRELTAEEIDVCVEALEAAVADTYNREYTAVLTVDITVSGEPEEDITIRVDSARLKELWEARNNTDALADYVLYRIRDGAQKLDYTVDTEVPAITFNSSVFSPFALVKLGGERKTDAAGGDTGSADSSNTDDTGEAGSELSPVVVPEEPKLSVVMPELAEDAVSFRELTLDEAMDAALTGACGEYETVLALDISAGGGVVFAQPKQVLVTAEALEGLDPAAALYHLDDRDTYYAAEKVDYTVTSSDTISFCASAFSPYVVVKPKTQEKAEEPAAKFAEGDTDASVPFSGRMMTLRESPNEPTLSAGMLSLPTLTALNTPLAASSSRVPRISDEIQSATEQVSLSTFSIRWLTKDTVDNGDATFLSLVPSDDNVPVQQFQIDFTVQARERILPGEIELVLPSYIWFDHEGEVLGELNIAIPEEPDLRGEFAYRREGDKIIITNPNYLRPVQSGLIQGSFRKISSHDVVDKDVSADSVYQIVNNVEMGKSQELYALLNITHNGESIGAEVGGLYSEIATSVQASSAVKTATDVTMRMGFVYQGNKVIDNIPEELLTGDNAVLTKLGEDVADYTFVKWFVSGTAEGNQNYIMSVTDSADIEEYGAILLGVEGAIEVDPATYKSSNLKISVPNTVETDGAGNMSASREMTAPIFSGYSQLTKSCYVWIAYKTDMLARRIQEDEQGIVRVDDSGNPITNSTPTTLTNTATITVTGWDDQEETVKTASADIKVFQPTVYTIKKMWDHSTADGVTQDETLWPEEASFTIRDNTVWAHGLLIEENSYAYDGSVHDTTGNDEWTGKWSDEGIYTLRSIKENPIDSTITDRSWGPDGKNFDHWGYSSSSVFDGSTLTYIFTNKYYEQSQSYGRVLFYPLEGLSIRKSTGYNDNSEMATSDHKLLDVLTDPGMELEYTLSSTADVTKWTYDGDDTEQQKMNRACYNKRPVKVVVEDTGLTIGERQSEIRTLDKADLHLTYVSMQAAKLGTMYHRESTDSQLIVQDAEGFNWGPNELDGIGDTLILALWMEGRYVDVAACEEDEQGNRSVRLTADSATAAALGLSTDGLTVSWTGVKNYKLYAEHGDPTLPWENRYEVDESVRQILSVKLYGSEEWIEAAEYVNGAVSLLAAAAENGALYGRGMAVSGQTVTLPEDTENFRITAETSMDSIQLNCRVGVIMPSTENNRALLDTLIAQVPEDYAKLWVNNEAKIDVYKQLGDGAEAVWSATPENEASTRGTAIVHGRNSRVAVRTETNFAFVEQDNVAKQIVLGVDVTMIQKSNIIDRSEYDSAVESSVIPNAESGRWYALLPPGVEPDLSTVSLGYGDDKIQEVYTVPNYEGSGRTLLVVAVELGAHVNRENLTDRIDELAATLKDDPGYPNDGYANTQKLSFKARYSYQAYLEAGWNGVRVSVAYEDDSDRLGNANGWKGLPDDPAIPGHTWALRDVGPDAALMADLDKTADDTYFAYGGAVATPVVIDIAAFTELSKLVAIDGTGVYASGLAGQLVTAEEGERYNYQIFVTSGGDAPTSDIVLIDPLERYIPSESEESDVDSWRGRFLSVDVSAIRAAGVDPVVYYSTSDEMTSATVAAWEDELTYNLPGDSTGGTPIERFLESTDTAGNPIWSTALPEDTSTVTAIAIDCRKDQNGEDYLLETKEVPDGNGGTTIKHNVLVATIHMVAPVSSESFQPFAEGEAGKNPDNNWHAFNKGWLSSQQGGAVGKHTLKGVYTKVGIVPSELTVIKNWDDAEDNDGVRPASVTVHVLRNGVEFKSSVLSEDNNWTWKLGAVPKNDENGTAYRYSVTEDTVYTTVPGGDGETGRYFLSKRLSFDEDGNRVYHLTNRYEPVKTTLAFEKRWEDDVDEFGQILLDENGQRVRPTMIQVQLLQDGVNYRAITVREGSDGSWSGVFRDLPKYHRVLNADTNVYEVVPYSYTIREIASLETYRQSWEGDVLTNRYYPNGDLLVSKMLTAGATDAAKEQEFSFYLALASANGNPLPGKYAWERYRMTGSEPDPTTDALLASAEAAQGVGDGDFFTLKGGEYLLLKDLPHRASYSIEEQRLPGFTLESSSPSGTIHANSTVQAAFTNSYHSEVRVSLGAVKELSGHELARYQFRFRLYKDAVDEANLVRAVTNGEAEQDAVDALTYRAPVTFGDLRFSEADDGQTYTYFIVEDSSDAVRKPGYTYDTAVYTVTVALHDDGNGVLTASVSYDDTNNIENAGSAEEVKKPPIFRNEYHAAEDLTLPVWKDLHGRDLKRSEFSFALYATAATETAGVYTLSGEPLATRTNDADESQPIEGVVRFAGGTEDGTIPALHFTEADAGKDYLFVVREIEGADTGVNYDRSLCALLVTVDDNGDGTLAIGTLNLALAANCPNSAEHVHDAKVKTDCPDCGGTGLLNAGTAAETDCLTCEGSGKLEQDCAACEGSGVDFTALTLLACETCGGSGLLSMNQACTACVGSGWQLRGEAPTFHNSLKPADLSIRKFTRDQNGDPGDETTEFTFRVRLMGEDINDDYSPSYTINKLPEGNVYVGAACTGASLPDAVTEEEAALYAQVFAQAKTLEEAMDLGESLGLGGSMPKTANDSGFRLLRPSADSAYVELLRPVTEENGVRAMTVANSGTVDGVTWTLDDDGVMTLMPTSGDTGSFVGGSWPWSSCKNSITRIVIGDETHTVSISGSAESMFSDCTGLISVDMTGFDTSGCTDMSDMFSSCDALRSVKLGVSFSFKSYDVFPLPPSATTTGKWIREDGAYGPFTSTELAQNYNGSTMAGTWVWEEIPTTYSVILQHGKTAGVSETVTNLQPTEDAIISGTKERFTYRGWSFDAWVNTADATERYPLDENGRFTIPANTHAVGDQFTLTPLWEHKAIDATLENGEFSFKLAGGEEAVLKDIPAGTSYQIWEETPTGWILLRQEGVSGLIEADTDVNALFVNQYLPNTATAQIVAFKTLDGQGPAADRFHFKLTPDAANPTGAEPSVFADVANQAGGMVLFPRISYSAAGVWRYTLTELVGEESATLSYDTSVYEITVTVTDEGENNLSAALSYSKDGAALAEGEQIRFENRSRPGGLQIDKTILGATPASEGQEFTLRIRLSNPNVPLSDENGRINYYIEGGASGNASGGTNGSNAAPGLHSALFLPAAPAALTGFTADPTEGAVASGDPADANPTAGDAHPSVILNDVMDTPVSTDAAEDPSTSTQNATFEGEGLTPPAGDANSVPAYVGAAYTTPSEGDADPCGPLSDTENTLYAQVFTQAKTLEEAMALGESLGLDGSAPKMADESASGAVFRLLRPSADSARVELLRPATSEDGVRATTVAIQTGTMDGVTWTIDDDGVLTIMPTSGNTGSFVGGSWPWSSYNNSITRVVIGDATHTVSITDSAYRMFSGCKNLKSVDLTGFDTSACTNMSYMFQRCNALTSLTFGEHFDTGNVTNMNCMFLDCFALTSLDVSGFNTSNVTNMSSMFSSCNALTTLSIGDGWDTGKVTSMDSMFNTCYALTSVDVSGWNTSNVTNMERMFNYCGKLQSLDVSGWNTSNVTKMNHMFYNCSKLESLNVSGWDTSNVTSMELLFCGCSSLTNLNVSGWNTSNVTKMNAMFRACSSLTSLDVSGFVTSNVTEMQEMFYNCSKLQVLDVSGFDTGKVTDMHDMFKDCSGVTSLDVSGFDTGKVTDMHDMFRGCSGLTSLDVSGFKTSNVTNMEFMFQNCSSLTSLDVSGFDTSKVTRMGVMFRECSSLTSLDVSGFDTSKVTEMHEMFFKCSSLTSLDVSGFDTSKVTTMKEMFSYCSSLTSLDVSGFDTSKVTDMHDMFRGCSGLTSLDVSGFNTSSVTNMEHMFQNCSSLTNLDVSGWDTSKVTRMRVMFRECSSLTNLDVSGWDTSKVMEMNEMFYKCSSLTSLDVSDWDTGKVTTMKELFHSCSGLTSLDLSSWNTGSVTNMEKMFESCSDLSSVTLSEDFSFKSNAVLPTPPNNASYTGKWIREDETFGPYTPAELRDSYTSAMTGTWVWQMESGNAGVLFDANGGFSSQGRLNFTAVSDVSMPDAGTTQRPGYKLVGWNTKADGSGTQYEPGVTYPLVTQAMLDAGSTLILYAQWRQLPLKDTRFTVKVYWQTVENGVAVPGSYEAYGTYSFSVGEVFPEVEEEAESYTYSTPPQFDGLKLNPDAVGSSPLGAEIRRGDNSTVLHYYYDRLSYELRYERGDVAALGTDPATETLVGGVPKQLRDNPYTLTKEIAGENVNFYFLGWKDQTGTFYSDGQTVLFPVTEEGQSFILTAQWLDPGSFQGGDFREGVIEVRIRGGQSLVLPELPAGTCYEIEEIDLPGGWTQSGQSGQSGTVSAANRSYASIENSYSARAYQVITVSKRLEGDALAEGQFQFVLTENGTELSTAFNGLPDGESGIARVVFDAIEYTQNDLGEHTYTVTERVPAHAEPGIAYDSMTVSFTVIVSDNGDGTLAVSNPVITSSGGQSSGESDTEFNNTVVPGALLVTKSVTGDSAPTGESFAFTLSLSDSEGEAFELDLTGLPALTKSGEGEYGFSLADGGTLTIPNLPKGTQYTVSETLTGAQITAGWSAAASTFSGVIAAGETARADFSNRYDAVGYSASGSLDLGGTKTFVGGEIREGEFSFQLLDGERNLLQSVTAQTNGSFSFEPIPYVVSSVQDDLGGAESKTFIYYVKELRGSEADVDYDTHEVKVTALVENDPDRKELIVTSLSYEDNATHETLNGLSFTNYKRYTLSIGKTVSGNMGNFLSRDFVFTLRLSRDGGPYVLNENPAGSFGNWDDSQKASGVYSFTLRHRGSLQMSLPSNVSYTVTESDECAAEGYTTSYVVTKAADAQTSGSTAGYSVNGMIGPESGDTDIAFTNRRQVAVPTSAPIMFNLLPLGVVSVMLLGIAALFPRKKKRADSKGRHKAA